MRQLLRFEAWGHHQHRACWKGLLQQSGKERLGGGIDVGERQNTPLLHTLQQGLHSGSIPNTSEQFACRFLCEIVRQVEGKLAARGGAVKEGRRRQL